MFAAHIAALAFAFFVRAEESCSRAADAPCLLQLHHTAARARWQEALNLTYQHHEHVRLLQQAHAHAPRAEVNVRLTSSADLETVDQEIQKKMMAVAKEKGCSQEQLQTVKQSYVYGGKTLEPPRRAEDFKFPGKLHLEFKILPKDEIFLLEAYDKVFATHNRNNGGHVWSNWLLSQSQKFTAKQLEKYFSMFCGVSGAPLAPEEGAFPQSASRWHASLKDISSGATRKGFMYYCTGCRGWPCLCDAKDFVRTDKKTVTLKNGQQKQYDFVVIGDPCSKESDLFAPYLEPGDGTSLLRQLSPEIACDGGRLKNAARSDNDHVIITMFHADDADMAAEANKEEDHARECASRSKHGFAGGMGMIFRKFAGVSPLDAEAEAQAKLAPTEDTA